MTSLPTSFFFQPRIQGWPTFNGRCYSFLITHTQPSSSSDGSEGQPRTRRVIFDLGVRKDWTNLMPGVVQIMEAWTQESGFGIEVERDVAEILGGNGVDAGEIEAVIWSHAHFDHIGNMQTFPSTVDLVVGPGIKDAYMPGWPAREVPVQESDFAGRIVREIDFKDSKLQMKGFGAHAIGHMNALVRTTTSPDTFMYLAGDSFHHPSQLRPNEALKLPKELDLPAFSPRSCPCQIFRNLKPERSPDRPFLNPSEVLSHDHQQAIETIAKIQPFDADDTCFVVAAHDESLYPVLEYFPKEANSWQAKGWKEKGRWPFLNDFAQAVRVGKESEK